MFSGIMISKEPVPVRAGFPSTMLPDGDVRLSKSPCRVASVMNATVVSKDALRRGELLLAIPLRLKGL